MSKMPLMQVPFGTPTIMCRLEGSWGNNINSPHTDIVDACLFRETTKHLYFSDVDILTDIPQSIWSCVDDKVDGIKNIDQKTLFSCSEQFGGMSRRLCIVFQRDDGKNLWLLFVPKKKVNLDKFSS
jgi:hypothetical protein